jgi:DNA-directed RNA polymerase subunit RPC12/RpoP
MEIGKFSMPFRKSTRILLAALLLLIGVILTAAPVLAQSATPDGGFTLNLHRTFGFGNGSQIRGQFSEDVIGPGTIQSATFLIDGKLMGKAEQAPFKFDFNTSSYSLGWHDLTASVQTADGKIFVTPARHMEFASADQESAVMRNILFPLLGVIFLVLVVVFAFQFLIPGRRPNKTLPLGAARNYGLLGGAICPQCKRPFAIHWYALKIGFGVKFDRCDYCGHRGLFKVVGRQELARAEAAELESAQPSGDMPVQDEAEKLKKILDDSRFSDNP